MSPTAIAEAKAFAEKENLHGVVRSTTRYRQSHSLFERPHLKDHCFKDQSHREAEKRTQRTKKKKVARYVSDPL